MKVRDAVATLEEIAPLGHAQSWDNVGLLVGDPDQIVSRALLTIDYTTAVAREARARGCDFVVSYHPPIFQPLKRVAAGDVIFDAVRAGISIYSPHTAIDAARGGTNDVLADALGLEGGVPLRAAEAAEEYKLVVFVPEANADDVSAALFEAGAGRIGQYARCSFRGRGTGTFLGDEGTNPAVGQSGRFETVEELRIETVLPARCVAPAIAALKRSHPYEEPAFDLVRLAPKPLSIGTGRFGALPNVALADLLTRIKQKLGLAHVLVAAPEKAESAVFRQGAVCAGACGDHLRDAARRGADVYLTGELRHHDALWAVEQGMTVFCVLHSNSERATLARLKDKLRAAWSGIEVLLSSADRDPFAVQ
jgi:dinuclear metal center YbgI/SA1388 family protein